MPIFRYRCRKCDATAARLVPRFDAEVRCEHCGSSEMEKLPSSFAAVTRSAASKCASAEHCPAAGSHQCGGHCGCGGN